MIDEKDVQKTVSGAKDRLTGVLTEQLEDVHRRLLCTHAMLLLLEREIVKELDNHRERENEV